MSVVVRRAIIGVALAAIVSAALLMLNASRHDVATQASKLRATNVQLTDVQHRLDAAGAALDVAQAQQRLAEVRLAQRQVQRDLSYAHVQAVQRQLHQQQHALTQTASDLAKRFARLGYLNQCVAGASKALNQAAVSDYGGLAVTLESVKDQCVAAKASS